MRIYLDPDYRNKCTVWFDNGNVQTLQGVSIADICNRIVAWVTSPIYNADGEEIGVEQIVEVYLDTMGVGIVYCDILDSHSINVKKCTYKKVIK